MKFFVVDAFTKQPFRGNPAGVVFLEDDETLPEETMQKLAAEVRFSETAFVREFQDGFEIRYFTPVSEIDLCGHATIATFRALMEIGAVERGGRYVVYTKVGRLNIQLEDELVMMEQGVPRIGRKFSRREDMEKIASLLRLTSDDILCDPEGLCPTVVSTGLWDLLVPVKSVDVLHGIVPDLKAIESFTKEEGLVSVHVFAFGEEGTTLCHTRDFAPLYGIPEESATGTANGALIYLLYHLGIVEGNKLYEIRQGESMNRPSEIYAKVLTQLPVEKGDAGVRVFVGGYGKVIVSGSLKI
ncbi:PhzF family phenazine biosynthesis protein [Fervidobacterium thailandense]|uniref:PhzF family phenazine biosynthesis protein n=1 Tax=Fervidobacterium thailandense TaxID=1008305 RepID=A0A1E3G517_9BACT|nr:PhzF family phenazine biosynthesis protein [Fervidobacterium thailandense]ODN31230.1 hypothetical protein A4H02_00130 [Fervidobacterium thailandense]